MCLNKKCLFPSKAKTDVVIVFNVFNDQNNCVLVLIIILIIISNYSVL